MPFGPQPPRFRAGAPSIACARLNASAALLERLGNLRGGPRTVWSPAGPLLGGEGLTIRLGITPSQGIPGKDTNGYHAVDVSDASLSISSDGYSATLDQYDSTFQGFNLSSQPVAGDAVTIYMWMWAAWWCIWEDCPSSDTPPST